jgi:hypothetical protein
VDSFTVISIDPQKAFDQISNLLRGLNPNGGGLDAFSDAVKFRTKRDLKTEILGHLGPRIVIYVAPGSKSSDSPKGPNPLAAMLGPLGGALANFEIPRLTIIADIDDPVAVGRVLDELMIVVNQNLRSLAPLMPAPDGNDPNGGATRKSRGGGSGLEFTSLPNDKYRGYKLNLPTGLSSLIPSYVRPTIRTSAKQIVFSISPEAARQALEIKGGGAAATTFSTALQSTPGKMIFLQASDPSDALSAALADFPTKLQQTLDAASAPPAALAAGPGGPGGPGPGGPGGRGGPGPGGSGAGISAPGMAGSGRPGGSGAGISAPGMAGPGGPGGSGGSGGSPASSASGIVIKYDSSKLPSTSAIKSLLFPGTATISVDDEGVKFITREAFPNIAGLVSGGSAESMSLQQLMKMATGQPPGLPAAGAVPPGAGPGAPAAPGGTPGGGRPGGRKPGMMGPGGS